MSKVAVSVLLAVLIGGGVVAGISLLPAQSGGAKAEKEALREVAALRESLAETREGLQAVNERLDRLESAQMERAAVKQLQEISATKADGGEKASDRVPADLREYVFACIDEERKLRAEEQERQREEFRKRREEQRKEREELSQGPYDRYNLKVNSMAKELGLNDAQRDAYYELVKKYSEKFSESRRELFAAARESAEGSEGDRRGRGRGGMRGMREGREQFRELSENLQKEFIGELEPLLTNPQLEAFNELSERSQGFMDMGQASAGGQDFGRVRGMFGGGRTGGGPTGFGGGAGRRGGGRGR